MSTRELVAEWWELWWCKPGNEPVRVRLSDDDTDYEGRYPRGVVASREKIMKVVSKKNRLRNKYWKIRHVMRWRINKHGIHY